METYIIPQEDLKIFYSETKKYFCHIPSGLIFNAENKDIDLFLEVCLNNKQTTAEDLKTYIDIYEALNETIAEYNEPVPKTESETFQPSCVVLNVSGKCNLLCPYCFARDSRNRFAFKSMDVTTSLRAIDYMISTNPNSKDYTIAFFGGEPFLETDIIELIIKETLKKYSHKVIHFTATTNGTILNNKILSLLNDYDFSLMISLDGPQEITNKLRPHINPKKETFSTVMKNVAILKENSVSIDFRATVVAGDTNILSIAQFFEQQKVPYHLAFCFGTQDKENIYSAWYQDNVTKLSNDIDELFEFYYTLIQNKQFIWGFYFLETIRDIALRTRSNFSCGAGINMFSVTDKGDIFSCMNYTPLANTKIGNIHTGIDAKSNSLYKAKPIQETVECNKCNARYFCSGGCMAERYAVNKTTSFPAQSHCLLEHLLFDKYLSAYQYIKNNFPDVMNGIIEHKQLYEN